MYPKSKAYKSRNASIGCSSPTDQIWLLGPKHNILEVEWNNSSTSTLQAQHFSVSFFLEWFQLNTLFWIEVLTAENKLSNLLTFNTFDE